MQIIEMSGKGKMLLSLHRNESLDMIWLDTIRMNLNLFPLNSERKSFFFRIGFFRKYFFSVIEIVVKQKFASKFIRKKIDLRKSSSFGKFV